MIPSVMTVLISAISRLPPLFSPRVKAFNQQAGSAQTLSEACSLSILHFITAGLSLLPACSLQRLINVGVECWDGAKMPKPLHHTKLVSGADRCKIRAMQFRTCFPF